VVATCACVCECVCLERETVAMLWPERGFKWGRSTQAEKTTSKLAPISSRSSASSDVEKVWEGRWLWHGRAWLAGAGCALRWYVCCQQRCCSAPHMSCVRWEQRRSFSNGNSSSRLQMTRRGNNSVYLSLSLSLSLSHTHTHILSLSLRCVGGGFGYM
jgi:hypothetical protein